MIPRAGQGYLRNRKELGHLNYKAGHEEVTREVLSGPAFFFVPLTVLTAAALLRGKTAKVSYSALNAFKGLMKNISGNFKEAASVKQEFVKSFTDNAFKDYSKGEEVLERLRNVLTENLNVKLSFKDKISNIFAGKANKKTTSSMLRKEATQLVTRLNKMNGKMLDNAEAVSVNGKTFNIASVMQDMSNYLDDFTKKAAKTDLDKAAFVEKFSKSALRLRDYANLAAISALSAFLVIIPKIYQTGKEFPGIDGLDSNAQQGKEVKNENK